jgi:hypothetical protein
MEAASITVAAVKQRDKQERNCKNDVGSVVHKSRLECS